MTLALRRQAARTAILLGVLLAFGLRAYHLDFQSLWSDEGISLLRSSLPLDEMLARMPVEHVPGYFILLHYWIELAGRADFALRFFSLLPSVWAVALVYRLAFDLGSRYIGLIVAALFATNGFQVWYAQEVRMYSWLLAAGLLSTLTFWRLMRGRAGWGVWLLYVVATTLSIYLHFFGFLIPLSHVAFAGVWLILRRPWRPLLPWIGAGCAVALLFAPWAMRALDLLAFEGWRPPVDTTRVPWLLLRAYTVGETMPAPWAAWLPWLYLALAAAGLAAWARRRRIAGWFLGVLLTTAIAVVWLLVVRQPDFHVRYPIFISAPLLLLAAGGIAGLDPGWGRRDRETMPNRRRLFSLGMTTALLAGNGVALHALYTDDSLHKPGFRSAAQAINIGVRPDDVVLVDGPNPDLVFNHYYQGPAPVHDLRGLSEEEWATVDETLAEATADARRAWEVLYFHPPGPVQLWLALNGWAAAPSNHNDIRLGLYGLPGPSMPEQPFDIAFGPALVLAHAAVQGPDVPTGELVRVTTRWRVLDSPPDYKFSLRLQSSQGEVVLADDYVPQNWFAPTSQWAVDAPAEDRRALRLPVELPPGEYAVTLRLYDPASGVAVETAQGPDVTLGEVTVTAP